MSDISPDTEQTWPIVVSLTRAADLLFVSRRIFVKHILPNLRTVSCGGRQLVPLAGIAAWRDDATGLDEGPRNV